MALSPQDFGESFHQFMAQMATQAPKQEPVFVGRLREHFGQEPAILPILSETFAPHEHPDIQVALDSFLAGEDRSAEVVGVTCGYPMLPLSLASLVASGAAGMHARLGFEVGPVQYANVSIEGDRKLACIQCGLVLLRDGPERLAVLLQGPHSERPRPQVSLEVMAASRERAERLLAELRALLHAKSVYRGRVLSLGRDMMGTLQVSFHRLPEVDREGIVLPEGLLERIERHAIRFSRHTETLRKHGRHLKRGLLLHGPPGTGKTLTAMYVARALRDRTVLLLTGRGLGLIERSCGLARALQPSVVVLEDVDLVAEERTRQSGCSAPVLFELLNEMDGLADDADVLFLLTTNRPDILEPALAARPGRVDQAFRIPLPDEACRRRLFALYGRGLSLDGVGLEGFVKRTEGASPAFIRELLRKAALLAADGSGELIVQDRHLDEALRELVVEGGELTRSLLGYQGPP
ncbi:MAG: 26S protease regulatory subunit [Planctomycetes bacterium]|nr:26S protease regulatory subunit [Planctomycetota bacterium]